MAIFILLFFKKFVITIKATTIRIPTADSQWVKTLLNYQNLSVQEVQSTLYKCTYTLHKCASWPKFCVSWVILSYSASSCWNLLPGYPSTTTSQYQYSTQLDGNYITSIHCQTIVTRINLHNSQHTYHIYRTNINKQSTHYTKYTYSTGTVNNDLS